jgi:hypothetical protein
VSPFIVLDVFSDDFCGKGLYDPGSNVSLVSLSTLKELRKKYIPVTRKFSTISGEDRLIGITVLKVRIFNIEKKIIFFVLDSEFCAHDFIIGLDIIPIFQLSLDENLNIEQKFKINVRNNFPPPASNVNDDFSSQINVEVPQVNVNNTPLPLLKLM